MHDSLAFAVFLILLGPAIGSFLTVVIDRLPRAESLVHPGSFCRRCGQRLGLRDLMPIFSYLLSSGKCRHCGAPVARWHLWVELACLLAALAAVSLGRAVPDVALAAVFLWLLIGLAAADLIWFRLPNAMTALLWLVAMGLAVRPLGLGQGPALMGAVLGAGSFWLLRLGYRKLRGREGLGLGDVKLMAGLGAAVGPWDLPLLVLLAALAALGGALVERRRQPKALNATRPLPFGAALCGAAAALWLVRQVEVNLINGTFY